MDKMSIMDLKGIGKKKAQALRNKGFHTIDDIHKANEEDIAMVNGITEKQAFDIKNQVSKLKDEHSKNILKSPNIHKMMPDNIKNKGRFFNQPYTSRYLLIFIVGIFIAGIVIGAVIRNEMVSKDLSEITDKTSLLEAQLLQMQSNQNTISYYFGNISLSELYQQVNDAIVSIHAYEIQTSFFGTYYSEIGGSGFIYNYSGQNVVITNYHVVHDTTNITVTLADGSSFPALLIGSDAYADLAVLEVDFGVVHINSLAIASSSTLEVGDPVIAIGNPFGLTGTMTTGIVSQLGRTIQESTASGFSIANIIQISTPINPGNSGGPLLNYQGEVVGITTAIIEDSEGLGFAVPSDTILRELSSLITKGSYTLHSWVGISGLDMSYDISQVMNVNVTYGWLISQVVDGGPAETAGLQGGSEQVQLFGSWALIGGDIIIAVDNNSIINGDMFMSYLEESTIPGQIIELTVIRNNEILVVPVELDARPLAE